ncbi:hypothetical protein T4C_2972, partial [Trichinella pseudospiralis]
LFKILHITHDIKAFSVVDCSFKCLSSDQANVNYDLEPAFKRRRKSKIIQGLFYYWMLLLANDMVGQHSLVLSDGIFAEKFQRQNDNAQQCYSLFCWVFDLDDVAHNLDSLLPYTTSAMQYLL